MIYRFILILTLIPHKFDILFIKIIMRNRVIITSKIDDLIIIDAESRPITPVTSNSMVLTSTKIKFDLLRSLKQRLDS